MFPKRASFFLFFGVTFRHIHPPPTLFPPQQHQQVSVPPSPCFVVCYVYCLLKLQMLRVEKKRCMSRIRVNSCLLFCSGLFNCSIHVDNYHHLLPLQRHAAATAAAAVAAPMLAAPADYQSRSTSQRSSEHAPAPPLV